MSVMFSIIYIVIDFRENSSLTGFLIYGILLERLFDLYSNNIYKG